MRHAENRVLVVGLHETLFHCSWYEITLTANKFISNKDRV